MALWLCSAAQVASAVQFTPPASARAHSLGSGSPGIVSTTVPVTGFWVFTTGTGRFDLNQGSITELHYFDPNDGACPTDAGSDCSHVFATPLRAFVRSELVSAAAMPLGPDVVLIQLGFGPDSTAAVFESVEWIDPTDSTTVLRGDLAPATPTGGGPPTPGLIISFPYQTALQQALAPPTLSYVVRVDPSSPYAALFTDIAQGGDPVAAGTETLTFDIFATTPEQVAENVLQSQPILTFAAQGAGVVHAGSGFVDLVPLPSIPLAPPWLIGALTLMLVAGGWRSRSRR